MSSVRLIISDESQEVYNLHIKVILKNTGSEKVMLPKRGDGSEYGQRTPKIGFNIQSIPKHKFYYEKPQAMCGSINPFRGDQFFSLEPNEEIDISRWYGRPRLKPGSYKITAYYHNDLEHPYGRSTLDTMDQKIADLLRKTIACNLTSNELIITIRFPIKKADTVNLSPGNSTAAHRGP